MPTTATLHVHPACVSSRQLIEQLQADTKRLVVIHGGQPRLVSRAGVAASAFNAPFGGAAR